MSPFQAQIGTHCTVEILGDFTEFRRFSLGLDGLIEVAERPLTGPQALIEHAQQTWIT